MDKLCRYNEHERLCEKEELEEEIERLKIICNERTEMWVTQNTTIERLQEQLRLCDIAAAEGR